MFEDANCSVPAKQLGLDFVYNMVPDETYYSRVCVKGKPCELSRCEPITKKSLDSGRGYSVEYKQDDMLISLDHVPNAMQMGVCLASHPKPTASTRINCKGAASISRPLRVFNDPKCSVDAGLGIDPIHSMVPDRTYYYTYSGTSGCYNVTKVRDSDALGQYNLKFKDERGVDVTMAPIANTANYEACIWTGFFAPGNITQTGDKRVKVNCDGEIRKFEFQLSPDQA